MTVTDTPRPVAPSTGATAVAAAPRPAAGGLAAVIGTADHKVVGRLYIGFSLVFGLAAVVAGGLVGIDRIDGELGNTILSDGTVSQVLTFHLTAAVFLFLVPLLLGIGLVLVPLQVGARSIAFPRAAAASFWAWLMGSGAFVASYLINGGPGGGDFQGVGLWAASYALLLTGLVLGAVCVVTTAIALRAPGLSLDRVPLFSWSMLVGGVVWILSLPVLIATLILIYVDHRYGQRSFGLNGPSMFTRVAWPLRQPQLYAFAAPALGLIADVIPVAARHRQPRRVVAMGAIGVFAVLGFGAFVQPAIYPRATVQPVVAGMAVLAILPVLALFGGWATTMRSGRPRLMSPLLFSVSAALTLLLAVVLGAAGSIERFELQGTLFDTGFFELTVFAAATAAVGGLWYWATKIAGRVLPEGLGRLAALVLLLGAVATAVPYCISGAFADGDEAITGIQALDVVSVAGFGLLLLGLALALLGLASGRKAGADEPDDPWEGQTLEWSTASPPTPDNFTTVPVVTSAEPLLDTAEDATNPEASA